MAERAKALKAAKVGIAFVDSGDALDAELLVSSCCCVTLPMGCEVWQTEMLHCLERLLVLLLYLHCRAVGVMLSALIGKRSW